MRIHLVRIVALVWFVGTFYISFRLFSAKTSLQHIGLADDGKFVMPRKLEAKTLPPKPLESDLSKDKLSAIKPLVVPMKKSLRYSTTTNKRTDVIASEDVSSSNISKGWGKYLKYKNIGGTSDRIWPIIDDKEDRVINQIHVKPYVNTTKPPKLILMRWGLNGASEGQFMKDRCPVDRCTLTDDMSHVKDADLVFYKDYVQERDFVWELPERRNPNQISMVFMLESPMHNSDNIVSVNWTASYRTDSVLNTPYERFAYFKNFTTLPQTPIRNFAQNKTKKVAWFVSNCWAPNGRLAYAKELAKYIDVDIYGGCGTLTCPRDYGICGKILKQDYKFYLSFENSNCQDYITEKFFVNALGNDILPIVMGARPEDYERLAPPKSFIHVDEFESPRELAEYLHKLDQNDDLYNSYFLWKGTGELIDTKFWCRLCALLHERDKSDVRIWYDNVQDWWNGPGVCQKPNADEETWSSWRGANTTTTNSKKTFHILNSSNIPSGL